MNKNFFKATGRAAKITGKDVKHLRRLQDQGRRTRC